MKTEVKLIDLGMSVLRLTKSSCLTKVDKSASDWNSTNFADRGEYTVRLDLLIAEDSCDQYSVPAKSASVHLPFEMVKEFTDFIHASGYQHGPLNETEISMIGAALRIACQNSDIEDRRLHSFGLRLWNKLAKRGFKIERTGGES